MILPLDISHGGGNHDRTDRTSEQTNDESEGERLNGRASVEIQDRCADEGGSTGHQRSAESLIDRIVDMCPRSKEIFALIFSDAIEDDDCVVQ